MTLIFRRYTFSIIILSLISFSCAPPGQSDFAAFALALSGSAGTPPGPAKPWPKFLGVFGSTTWGFAASGDHFGNIIATGFTEGNLDGQVLLGKVDAFIVKYDSEGSKLWTRHFGGGPKTYTEGSTTGYSISSDPEGHVVSTGYTNVAILDGQNLNGYEDAYVVKYDPDGNKEWTRLIGGGSKTDFQRGTTIGRGIASDPLGNIYVVGTTNAAGFDGETNSGAYDCFLVKYNPEGDKVWTRFSGNTLPDTERIAGGVVSDSNGDVYLVGAASSDLDGQTLTGVEDAMVIKYDGQGNKLWTRLLGVAAQVSVVNAVSTDSDQNIYITGNTSGEFDGQVPIGTVDTFIVKYDKDGNKQWTKLFGDPSFSTNFAAQALSEGISTDSNGNSYIAGTITARKTLFSNSVENAFVVKYDTNGNIVWSNLKYLQEDTKCVARAQDVVLGLDDTFFVAGFTNCLLSIIDPASGIDSLFISRELISSP